MMGSTRFRNILTLRMFVEQISRIKIKPVCKPAQRGQSKTVPSRNPESITGSKWHIRSDIDWKSVIPSTSA
jgi:hypothetical protein